MKAVQPAAIFVTRSVSSFVISVLQSVLTKFLEDSSRLLKDEVEIPTASERPYRGLHTMAFPTDHPDLDRAVLSLRECFGDPARMSM